MIGIFLTGLGHRDAPHLVEGIACERRTLSGVQRAHYWRVDAFHSVMRTDLIRSCFRLTRSPQFVPRPSEFDLACQ